MDTSTGNVSLALASNPGGATLGGASTLSASAGVATFTGLTLNKAGGPDSLQASGGTLTSATTTGIQVNPAAATQWVVIIQPPSSATAGSGFSLTVAAEDSLGNVVTTYGGSVSLALASNPGGATLGGASTLNISAGAATFTGLTLNKAGGPYTAERASGGTLTAAATTGILVSPAPATQWVVTTQPPSSATAGSAFSLTVTAEDGSGNVNTTYSGSVTLALAANPGGATLGGVLTGTASAGAFTFTGLKLNKAAMGYTLAASGGSLSAATSNSITIVAAPASQWVIATQPPASLTAGVAFGLVVSAEDSFGNVAPSYNGSVSLTLAANPGGATLGGAVTQSASAGVASFTGLTLNKAGGPCSLNVSGGTLTAATTTGILVSPAAATQWVVTTQPPSSAIAGSAFSLTVAAEDGSGNVNTTYSGSVTLALAANPGGATLGGVLTGTASAPGVASFTGLTLNKAGGPYSLSITGGTLTAATTTSILVSPAPATQWVVTTQPPSSATVGSAFSLTVAAEDGSGNVNTTYSGSVSLALAANPGGATLGGVLTGAASAGVASFTGLTLNKAGGPYSLSITGGTLTAATTNGILVSPAAATQWVVTSQPPSSATAGSAFSLTVAAEDGSGNMVTTYSGSVALALAANPGGATLGGVLTGTASAGAFTFTGLMLNKAAMGYTLAASGGSLSAATSNSITIVAAPASQWVIATQPPASLTAGVAFGLVVSAEDSFGNVAPSYTGNVSLALAANPGGATLGGAVTQSASAGVASFTGLTLNKAGGPYSLKASGGTLTAATTNGILVSPAAATHWVVTTQPPSSATAGSAFSLTVAAEDGSGNVITTYSGSVTLALAANPGGATLSGVLTGTASAGAFTFTGLKLNKAAMGYTLAASGGSLSAATSNSITIVAAAASQWVIATQPPASVTAGAGFGLVVAAEDSFGNVAPSYTGNVSLALASNPGGATLGGTVTQSTSAGVASFTGLTLNKAGGPYSLKASGGTLTAATTTGILISPAPATHWIVTTQPPSSATAGSAFSLTVAAEDAFGNMVTTYSGSATLALAANPGGATLSGVLTGTPSAGVMTFTGLKLNKAATGYTLAASGGSLSTATSNSITIVAAAASQWVISTQPPATLTVGVAFGLVVSAEDSFGNVAPSYTGSVSLALASNPEGATLGGASTLSASAGAATFTGLTLNKAGGPDSLKASGGTLTSATSTGIQVSPAAATQWVVTTQPPSSATAGSGFSVTVAAEDGLGNVVTTYGGNVSLALAANPGGATLSGTLTGTAHAGVMTFTGLMLNKAALGYTLAASGGGLTAATTNSIAIVAAPASQGHHDLQPPASVTAGAAFGLVVTAEDSFGNVATSYTGSVSLALASNPGGATLGGVVTLKVSAGVATFAGLTLNKAGGPYALKASGGKLTSTTTSNIQVTSVAAP